MTTGNPREGDQAPDFTLEGPDGPFTLSEHRGETVVLLFYPGDQTAVCTRQFCSYRDRSEEIEALGAIVVGISGKDVASKEAFTRAHDLTVPLLADADGAVAEAYGVASRFGPKRSTFVVDPDGRIAAAKVHRVGLRYEDVDDIVELVGRAGAPA
jgi:peroxiredoxin Q/BCP